MDELLTVNQLAKHLHLNPVTVRRKVANGEIPAVRIGRRILFNRGIIDRWLLENGTEKSLQVLIIDDEPIVVNLIQDILREEAIESKSAMTSQEALSIIKQERFNLIFLDLIMPELDGSEIFKYIREIDKDVPVAIITGFPDSTVMAKAMQYGPFVVVKKPFTREEIRALVGSLV